MTALLTLVPVAIAAVGWYALYLVDHRAGWLRRGEVIFWDAVFLVVVYLLWLRWS